VGNCPHQDKIPPPDPSKFNTSERLARCNSKGVTLRIETTPGKRRTTIKLVGRVEREHLPELKKQLGAISQSVVLDLGEVSLVNVEVVRFLGTCESQGIQLTNCSAYVRKWIDTERQHGEQ
jgi:hypothetical protein